MKTKNHQKDKRQSLLPRTESSAYCALSTRTWSRLNASGNIPRPVRIGGSVRWRLSDLDLWISWGCPSRQEFEARKGTENAKN